MYYAISLVDLVSRWDKCRPILLFRLYRGPYTRWISYLILKVLWAHTCVKYNLELPGPLSALLNIAWHLLNPWTHCELGTRSNIGPGTYRGLLKYSVHTCIITYSTWKCASIQNSVCMWLYETPILARYTMYTRYYLFTVVTRSQSIHFNSH